MAVQTLEVARQMQLAPVTMDGGFKIAQSRFVEDYRFTIPVDLFLTELFHATALMDGRDQIAMFAQV